MSEPLQELPVPKGEAIEHPLRAVVLDAGSDTCKVGYGGEIKPAQCIPNAASGYKQTAAASQARTRSSRRQAAEQAPARVCFGAEALRSGEEVAPVVRAGRVADWDLAEQFWAHCYSCLGADPEAQTLLLAEPTAAPPAWRERAAEAAFESLGVPGLYFGVPSVLALYTAFAAAESSTSGASQPSLTGLVVEAGEGCTHLVPVVDCNVISTAIASYPLTGHALTSHVKRLLQDGQPAGAPVVTWDAAQQAKESACFVAKDAAAYRSGLSKASKPFRGTDAPSGRPFAHELGPAARQAPEAFFQPLLWSTEQHRSLPEAIVRVVQSCPIDVRRALYGNIVLSGGATKHKGFGRRLQAEVQQLVSESLPAESSGVQVLVRSHALQRHGVWVGGSVLAATPDFPCVVTTREQYEEGGAAWCRAGGKCY